ncbi:MAG: AMMECR1 domain-containing protein, partial [bacterium]|nr:AMMECR1 domain-containing protein [bacterium]
MRLLLGRNIEQQIAASLAWMSEVVTETDRIFVDFPAYHRYFHYEFPLRPGDPPRVARRVRGGQITFIICGAARRQAEHKGWTTIFATPAVSVLEKKSNAVAVPPLRWGLTPKEQQKALHIARETLKRFLMGGERPTPRDFPGLPQKFFHKANLGAAIWINGRLRGSWIEEDQYFIEGLITAVTNAGQDPRFKPPTNHDLAHARIEITLAHRLRLPLSADLRAANRILPEKGYVFSYGAANGWYLPEVFNVRRFRTLEELLGDLAQEKVHLPRETHREAKIFICEVDDFIESADRSRALSLSGPVVKPKPLILDATFLEQRLRIAADWLCRIQEPDGNIPPVTDPFSGHQAQMDWPRLAFTAWALT